MAIENDAEYQHSKEQTERIRKNLKQKETELMNRGILAAELKNLLDPERTWLAGLEDEIADYESRAAARTQHQ